MSGDLITYLAMSVVAVLALAVTFLATGWSMLVDTSGGPARPSGTAITLTSLKAASSLGGSGLFEITVYRQSGYAHSRYLVTGAAAAVAKAVSTFGRARIETVEIIRNTPNELYFAKVLGGSVRGKGVGAVEIKRLT